MRVGDFLWVGLGQVAATIGGFALLKLQGVWLSPEQFGHLVLAINAAGFVQGVLVAGHAQAATRYSAEAVAVSQGNRLFLALFEGLLWRLLLVLPVAFILGGWAVQQHVLSVPVVVLALGLSLAQALSGVADGWMLSHGRQRIFATMVATGVGLRFCLAFGGAWLAVKTSLPTEYGFLAGFLAAWTLLAMIQWMYQRHDWWSLSAGSSNHAWTTKVRLFAKPFLAWSVAGWVQTAGDRWSLSWGCGPREVGMFGAASQLCGPPAGMAAAVISNFAAPRLVARAGAGQVGPQDILPAWRWLAWYGVALIMVACLVLIPCSSTVVQLLLSHQYIAIAPVLPVILASTACFALAQVLTTPFQVLNPVVIHHMKVIVPIVGALGALLGAWMWGLVGVIAASAFTNAVYLLWVMLVLHSPGAEVRLRQVG